MRLSQSQNPSSRHIHLVESHGKVIKILQSRKKRNAPLSNSSSRGLGNHHECVPLSRGGMHRRPVEKIKGLNYPAKTTWGETLAHTHTGGKARSQTSLWCKSKSAFLSCSEMTWGSKFVNNFSFLALFWKKRNEGNERLRTSTKVLPRGAGEKPDVNTPQSTNPQVSIC